MANFVLLSSSRPFFEKRMGQEIDGENMGEDYKGYIFKITGGNDQQGFAMKQGIMKNGRSRILFKKSKWYITRTKVALDVSLWSFPISLY